jgi:hypothetical protein
MTNCHASAAHPFPSHRILGDRRRDRRPPTRQRLRRERARQRNLTNNRLLLVYPSHVFVYTFILIAAPRLSRTGTWRVQPATVSCLTLPRRSCSRNSRAPIDDAALVVFSTTERRNRCSLTSEPRLRFRPRGRRYVHPGRVAPARWYAPHASAATRLSVLPEEMQNSWRICTLAETGK